MSHPKIIGSAGSKEAVKLSFDLFPTIWYVMSENPTQTVP